MWRKEGKGEGKIISHLRTKNDATRHEPTGFCENMVH
jgi:hypothetical protein